MQEPPNWLRVVAAARTAGADDWRAGGVARRFSAVQRSVIKRESRFVVVASAPCKVVILR